MNRALTHRMALYASRGLVMVAIVEGASLAVIAFSGTLLGRPILRTRALYESQSASMRLLLEPSKSRREMFDPLLGWRYQPGYHNGGDRINAQGLRSAREYEPTPGGQILRVAAFGSSFVYCNEVENEDGWPSLLEEQLGDIEVLNYGVGGYGIDQAYLRYLAEGSVLKPAVVIIGIAPDDLGRTVNVFRRFIDPRDLPLTKPRFELQSDGELKLRANPLPQLQDYQRLIDDPQTIKEIARDDYWYQPAVYDNPLYDWSGTVRLLTDVWVRLRERYLRPDRFIRDRYFDPTSRAFRTQMRLFEKFHGAIKQAGATPLVVVFPDRDSIERGRRGERPRYAPLSQALAEKGIRVVDVLEGFLAAGDQRIDQWFMPRGHYSRAGNGVVAAQLTRELGARAKLRSRRLQHGVERR